MLLQQLIPVLPSRSCTMTFAIQAMSRATSLHVCMNTLDGCLMFLVMLTSDLIASFVRGLTVRLYYRYIYTAKARLHTSMPYTVATLAIIASL